MYSVSRETYKNKVMKQKGTVKQLYARYAQQLKNLALKAHKAQHHSDQIHLQTIQLETKIKSVEDLLISEGEEEYMQWIIAENARRFVDERNQFDHANKLRVNENNQVVDESTKVSGGSQHTPINDPAGSGAQRPSDT